MNTLRPGLPPLPPKMSHLPIDARGFPVPFFVAMVDGKPDHRVADTKKLETCLKRRVCWICGEPLGQFKAYVIGPMCGITRTVADPPSHLDCATYAATACPFLARPHAKRRTIALPGDIVFPPGNGIKRNPGVAGVWVSKQFRPFRVDNGFLFDIGSPTSTTWYCEGRPATRAEVDESITSGLHLLRDEAHKEGPEAVAEFVQRCNALDALLDRTLPRHLIVLPAGVSLP